MRKHQHLPILMLIAALSAVAVAADGSNRRFNDDQIRDAFAAVHQGRSTDELLIDESLRIQFLKHLRLDPQNPAQFDQHRRAVADLLRLRKTGQLGVSTTTRSQWPESDDPMVAEIAARTVLDRHRCSIDELLCDPILRDELQAEAVRLQPNIDAAKVRLDLLRLRKTRNLRPELVLRVAEWNRHVVTHPIKSLDLDLVPEQPGIYLFRDATGYLYVGEAQNLRVRMQQHFDGSHNEALSLRLNQPTDGLTLELHVFDKDSPAERVTMRRAYESELIRSRHPKFNVRP